MYLCPVCYRRSFATFVGRSFSCLCARPLEKKKKHTSVNFLLWIKYTTTADPLYVYNIPRVCHFFRLQVATLFYVHRLRPPCPFPFGLRSILAQPFTKKKNKKGKCAVQATFRCFLPLSLPTRFREGRRTSRFQVTARTFSGQSHSISGSREIENSRRLAAFLDLQLDYFEFIL